MPLLVLWVAIFRLLSTSICVKAADVVMMDADREMTDDAANCIVAVASPSLQSQDMDTDIDVSGSLMASQSSGMAEGEADAGSCTSQNHEEQMELGGDDQVVVSSTLEKKDVCSQESFVGYAEAEIASIVPEKEAVRSSTHVENEDASVKDVSLPLPATVDSFIQSSTASDISASQTTAADTGSDSQSTDVADTDNKGRPNEETSSVTPVQPYLAMSDIAGDIGTKVEIAVEEKDVMCELPANMAHECETVIKFETPEKSAADDSAAGHKDELLITHPADESSIARSDPDPSCAGATCASSKVQDDDDDATKLRDDGLTDTQKLTSTGRIRALKTTPKSAKAENDDWVDHEQLQWELEPLCGLAFNEKGELRDKKGNPFVFEVSANPRQNQQRYERLGEGITEEIYKLLEEQCHLKRIYLPLDVEDEENVEKPAAADETVNTGQCGAGEPDQQNKPECAGEGRGATPTSVVVGVVGDRGDEIKPRRPTQINKPHSFIFVSDNWATADRLLILIHGSGVVRAGQWARRLIINDDLEKGTQMPYIERALQEGYGVVVLNTNLNRWPDVSDYSMAENIPENKTPESHATYVWRKLISSKAKAQHIAIVAHSYGGIVTKHLVTEELEECQKRVFAVAFTDSVHGFGYFTDTDPQHTEKVQEFFATRTRNWVTSDKPRDEPMPSYGNRADSPRISAGHTKHEWTSYASFDSVFKFFEESYQKRLQAGNDIKPSSPGENKPMAEKIPCTNL